MSRGESALAMLGSAAVVALIVSAGFFGAMCREAMAYGGRACPAGTTAAGARCSFRGNCDVSCVAAGRGQVEVLELDCSPLSTMGCIQRASQAEAGGGQ